MKSPRRIRLAVAWFTLAASAVAPAFAQSDQPIVIVGASLIPLDSARVVPDQTLIVRHGHIIAVGRSDSVRPPNGARIVDARGMFVMPGLTDMHVHLERPEEFAFYLAEGVTTVLNLRGRPWHLQERDAIARGSLVAPRLLTCGPYIRGGQVVATVVAQVDSIVDAGYDCVKVKDDWTPRAYRAVAEATRRRQIVLLGHAPRNLPFDTVIAVGEQRIAHLEELIYTTLLDSVTHAYADRSLQVPLEPDSAVGREIRRLAAAVKHANIRITATEVVIDRYMRRSTDEFAALLASPEVRFLDPVSGRRWQRARVRPATAAFREQLRVQQALLAELHRVGATVLVGTDAESGSSLMVMPGWSLHRELELFVEAGYSPFEALRAATVDASDYFGRAGREGCLNVNCRADLVILRRNPLESIQNASTVETVILRSRVLTRRDLDEALEEVVRSHAITESEIGKLASVLAASGPAAMIRALRAKAGKHPDLDAYVESELNARGYGLMRAGKLAEALQLFELNTRAFPASGNVYDSWGEALLASGDTARAVRTYRRGLEVANRAHDDRRGFVRALERLGALPP